MPRFTCIYRWAPEKSPEVLKRFAEFVKGVKPEVTEAFKRINYITWEFTSYFGQTNSVMVVEGDEADISTVFRYWFDLGTFEILPSVDFETIIKFYPDKIIHTLNP